MRTIHVGAGMAALMILIAPCAVAQAAAPASESQPAAAQAQQRDDTLPPPVARRPELGLGLGVAGGDLGGFLGHVDVTAPGLSLIRHFDGRLEYDDWRSGVLWGSGERKQGRAFTFTQVSTTPRIYYGGGLGFLSTDRAGKTTQDYCVQ